MKPLSIEELQTLEVGDWVWIVTPTNNGEYYQKCYDCQNTVFSAVSIHYLFCEKYADYGKTWTAYKNKEFKNNE